MRILGIETSCDETAAAVVEVTRGQFSVLSNVVASQIKIHAKTGGVVPEVAARAHVEKIIPVIERALKEAKSGVAKSYAAPPLPPTLMPFGVVAPNTRRAGAHDFAMGNGAGIDAIAVTAGPGLMTSLLVGVEVARTLSALWKKPLIAVNHLAGHVYANWLNANGHEYRGEWSRIKFPLLALIVSGGHTELVLMKKHMDFKIIGSTRDDAAGEAFDKVAKMLGLPYPGGPAVSAMAEKFFKSRHLERPEGVERPHTVHGDEISPLASGLGRNDGVVQFPRPMINSSDFDFSFSGLKTAVLYYLKNLDAQNHVRPHMILYKQKMQEICYEFQEAAVDVLVSKTIRAAKQYKVKTVLLGGGVAANKRLREQLGTAVKSELPTTSYVLPSLQYTGDNAAMIAAAGYFMARKKQFTFWHKLEVDPNWELGQKFNPLPR